MHKHRTMNCSPYSIPQILISFILSLHLFSIITSQPDQPHHQNPSKSNQNTITQALNSTFDDLQFQLENDPDSEKQEFLAAHNKVRLHVGEPLMVWDTNLAFYAGEYAKKRAYDCNLIHSHGPYGENIFWGGGNNWTPTDMVKLWVKEHRYYTRATNKCQEGKMCGHYTQIVWRDSVRLGCARALCKTGDVFAICSYDPPGNYIGEHPFGVHH